MAYNIAGLPAYTNQQSTLFITKTILGTATIAVLMSFGSFDPNAKGSTAIQLLDTEVVIQSGETCGRNPLGGATLTQDVLTVKPLMVNQDYCVKDLVKVWAVEELKAKMKGLKYTDALFLNDIGELNVKKTQLAIENMIWKGDTTLQDITLKQIDGFIKQIKAGNEINLNPTAQTNATPVIDRLIAIPALMPIEITTADDFRILIGQDMEQQYLASLAAKNLFNPVGNEMIFGTKLKYIALPGLNGTGVIVAARMSRLVAGGEMIDAKFEKYYSMETKKTYFDSDFSLGVVPVYREEIGLGTWLPA